MTELEQIKLQLSLAERSNRALLRKLEKVNRVSKNRMKRINRLLNIIRQDAPETGENPDED